MKIKNVFNEKLVLVLFLLFFLSSWFLFPTWSLNTICLSFCNGLVVLGLLMLMRMGLISFGHGMYYCLGGYAVAMSYNFLKHLNFQKLEVSEKTYAYQETLYLVRYYWLYFSYLGKSHHCRI